MSYNEQTKHIVVYGLGQSGLSAARYFQRIEQDFYAVDSRENPPGKDELQAIACCKQSWFGDVPQEILNQASQIILSPGVAKETPAIVEAAKAGAEVIGDVELFVRETKGKIIAITGSNGKSTVTELTHKLLVAAGVNAQIGGNFGVPVLDYLPEDAGDYYVLELSSFQLDTTQSLRAEIAVILNITEDHMDRYADFNAYKQSKLSIYNGAKNIIANYDDELTFPEKSDRYKVFSLHEQTADYHLNYQNDSAELVIDNQGIIDVSKLMLSGSHNWSNALVAIGIVKQVAGEIDKNVLSALTSYQGLPHRFQLVKSDEGIDWINDSKATNVGATQAAINAIDLKIYGCIVLIAGGDAKGSDLSPLSSSFERVTHFILIGRDAPMFRKIIIDNKVTMATTLQDAIDKSYNFIKSCHQNVSGKAMVLLSPACASFDMFDNYMDRGNKFAEAVNQLGRSAL